MPRLYRAARIGSNYERSLSLLEASRRIAPDIPTKSGLMLGLGEGDFGRNGPIDADQVARVIRRVTGGEDFPQTSSIGVLGGRVIHPRTAGQAEYVEAIRQHALVFCTGPAGTGKTYLAVA